MVNRWFQSREQCPSCTSKDFATLYRSAYDQDPVRDYLRRFYQYGFRDAAEFKYLEGASYILCECKNCGLIFQKEIPNEALMCRLYEQWVGPEDASTLQQNLQEASRDAQEIMQIIASFGRQQSRLRFLDFGMGWGGWAMMARAFGCESYGCELSGPRITFGRSLGINVLPWEEILQRRFDFINTEQVFEHIAEPLQTLRSLSGSLAPHGLIKISVPGAVNLKRRLKVMDWNATPGSRNSLMAVAPLEHINCFRRRSIIAMARQCGMTPVSLPFKAQYGYLTNWSGVTGTARNLLTPLYRKWFQNYIFLRNSNLPAGD